MAAVRTGDAKGRWAEAVCEAALRLKGYRICARRFRSGLGEIDLIAARGRVLAFIEVKFRPTESAGLEALSERQQQRIVAAAHHFLARHPRWAGRICRFDLCVVTPWRWPRHHTNAFSA